ncbi:MAG: sigma 54-interacting transcriptional regulator [Treponema sp.]|nr:sigma 54-interacting transcriptional regulator [Treponema sp.]
MSEPQTTVFQDSTLMRSILDTSFDGITYTDRTGVIIYNNPAYYKITGLNESELLGESIFSLARKGYPISRMAQKVFQSQETLSRTIRYRPDSNTEVLVTVVPRFDDTGTFSGIIANVRDITMLNSLRNQMDTIHATYSAKLQRRKDEIKQLKEQIARIQFNLDDYNLVGRSPEMQQLVELAQRIAQVDSTVLILGESGVGKDVFCKMIGKFAGKENYTKISCGAIPESLLESELFGYEAGSFTGASKTGKPGIFSIAGDGIVFLDEIGELPLAMQVKLLTVLQDRQFFAIGGKKPLPMRARIISATHRDLKTLVADGTFREDLYYRLNVIPVHIPPLRERKEDIMPIACHLLERLKKKYNQQKIISNDLASLLTAYNWPGNIRELHNILERMFVLSPHMTLTARDFPCELNITGATTGHVPEAHNCTLKEITAATEKEAITARIHQTTNLHDAAQSLGINLSTLVRKMQNIIFLHENSKK